MSMDTSGIKSLLPKDFLKKHCEADPKFAFEQYVSLYHACFKPATAPGPYGRKSSSYFHKKGIHECADRLKKWDTPTVRAGATNENPDRMLEYGLRLATGTQAKYDEDAAYALFKKVIHDSYPSDKRAIAANLACTCLKRKMVSEPETFDFANAFALAEISALFGLFTFCSLHLVQMYERVGKDLQNGPGSLNLTHLWPAYDKFREETGTQRTNPLICAACNKKPPAQTKLKRCAGHCISEKKPLYCSRDCQKADWLKHRKWCKLEEVESDSEWTTDSEREDWQYSDDDLDVFDDL